jgi:PAS domain S-box-containing protein
MKDQRKEGHEFRDLKDLVVISIGISLLFAFFSLFDLFEKIRLVSVNPQPFSYIQLLFVITLFSLAAAIYSVRRWRELRKDFKSHVKAEEELRDNEQRLISTVDLSPDTIIIHRDSRIIFMNRAGVYLLGAANQDEIIGRDIKEFIHHDYIDIVTERINRMNRGNLKVPNIEIKLRRIDALIVDVEVASTPITYHEIPHIITIIRDITERKKSEERLRESEERLQSILDNTTAVVFLKDINGQYILINKQFEKLFNISREHVRWKTDYDLFPKDLAEVFRANDKRVLESRQPITIEEMAPHNDGLHTYLSVKFPLYNGVGFPYAVCGIATDITEKKKNEQELKRYAEDLALSNEELYVFSYAASHDLQEPLRNVENFINLLQKASRKKTDKKFLNEIGAAEDGVIRMSRLINDFLTYSRVGTDKAKYEQTNLNNVMKDALSNLKTAISETKAKITYKELPKINCNPLQMTQVFQNLLSNAIKYKGEKNPDIRITAEKKDGQWLFSVKDNGIGIEPWFYERIFLLFQKMHDPKKYPGSGIGLALCKRVIEKHGGNIWLESEKGKGTTFYFTIPQQ